MAGTAARPPKAAGQGLKSSRRAASRGVGSVRGCRGGPPRSDRPRWRPDRIQPVRRRRRLRRCAWPGARPACPTATFSGCILPGIQLVLAPFAALAYLIGEPASFVVVRLAFVAAGGLDSSPHRTAAVAGRSDRGHLRRPVVRTVLAGDRLHPQTVGLEGLNSLLLVIALLLLTPASRSTTVTADAVVAAGALLGLCRRSRSGVSSRFSCSSAGSGSAMADVGPRCSSLALPGHVS